MTDKEQLAEEAPEPRTDQTVQESGDRDPEALAIELQELKDRYLRLYAEFENYKKKTIKEKEELLKYANESLVYDLLPALDNFEMALRHTAEGGAEKTMKALEQGVENTYRELCRILEKAGLKAVEAQGKPFDPAYHHAMTQVAREDLDENIVAEEFRKGYLYKDKVLRPSLVSVSTRQ
jgi:molecular chaperone GrpE